MIQFNASLILPGSRELDAPYNFPMAAHYTTDNYALCFIAGRHDYFVGAPTHQLIDREWNSFQPQAVVLEGYTSSTEPSWNDEIKDRFVDRALQSVAINPTEQNEARYTLLKAHNNDVAIYSGEMSDQRRQEIIEQAGYTAMDYAGWMFLRRLSCEANIADLSVADVQHMWRDLSPLPDIAIETFYVWHRTFMGQDFIAKNITANEEQPSYADPSGKWKRLDDIYSNLRDRSALHAIETALNTHHRVLIVYGGSHYGCLRPALDAALGQPVITQ